MAQRHRCRQEGRPVADATHARYLIFGYHGAAMDCIFVESIEFYAYHGASDEEQSVGHRYSVNVRLSVDVSKAGASDNLPDTVNYAAVAARIVEIGTQQQFRLLEALAERMAEALLKVYPVESVEIEVRKLHPPMNVIASAVGVHIVRTRHTS